MPRRSASRRLSACTRDALGRIASRTETFGANAQLLIPNSSLLTSYSYDLRGRLVSVTTNGVLAESYAYDLNGNRTNSLVAADLRAAVYDVQDSLLSSGGATFACDANGSLTNKTANGQATAYSYDLFGRLESVTLPDGRIVSYDRDALHRVTAKRVNGAVTQGWIYKDGLAPVAETDASGAVVSFFVYGTSPFSPDYMVRDGATYRLIRDFAGSVRLVVNADTGAIAQRLDYDSFGNVQQDTNPGFQPFGFKSGLYDSDTGLVHFGARWYDPATGRWISKDPILLAGGLNLYAFCGNDPVNFSDPWGLCEGYSDPRIAAIEAVKQYNPMSISEDKEYAGYIYFKDGKYYWSDPVIGEYDKTKILVPEDAFAFWHTHGDYDWFKFNEDHFSRYDATAWSTLNRIPCLLGTPSGKILQISPATPNDWSFWRGQPEWIEMEVSR